MCACVWALSLTHLDRHNPVSFKSLKTQFVPHFGSHLKCFCMTVHSMVFKHGAFVISNHWSMWCPLGAFAHLGAFSLGGGLD
jgi:hypothetical protein